MCADTTKSWTGFPQFLGDGACRYGTGAPPTERGGAGRARLSAAWLNLWSARLGTTDRRALERTFGASTRMETARPCSSPLDIQSKAKMRRLSFKGTFPRARAPWAIVHMDSFRVRRRDLPQTADGDNIGIVYALVCVCDYSRFVRVYFAKRKDQIPSLVRLLLEDIGARTLRGSHFIVHNMLQQHIHTDGGTEINNAKVNTILREFGLASTVTSAPDSPSSNGLAEVFVGILLRDARARMVMVGLRADLWHYAFWDAAAKRNLIASQRVVGTAGETIWVSPYQLAMGTPPDMQHVVAFGAPCCVLATDAEQSASGKLSLRTADGIVLGWAGEGVQVDGPATRMILGYVVLLDEGRVVISRNVRVDERQLVLRGGVTPWSSSPTAGLPGPGRSSAATEPGESMDTDEPVDIESPEPTTETPSRGKLSTMDTPSRGELYGQAPITTDMELDRVGSGKNRPHDDLGTGSDGDGLLSGDANGEHYEEEINVDNRAPLPRARDTSGLSRGVRTSTLTQRAERMYACVAEIDDASLPVWNGRRVRAPQTWDQAMASPLAEKWREAAHEHLNGIQSKGANGTFVERLVPAGTRLIPTKWVFVTKTDGENNVVRFKARVVVQGFRQREGIDYNETFSPTVRNEQVRLLMAVAARECGERCAGGNTVDVCPAIIADTAATGDCKDAYNTAMLDENERLLIKLPPGYEPKLQPTADHVVAGELETAMPGIRQGGRKWHEHFEAQACDRMGFVASRWAPCIYTRRYRSGILIMGRFVDDLLIVAVGASGGLSWLKASLARHFSIKFGDMIDKFVGAQFKVTDDGVVMHLSQYVSNMLAKYDPTGTTTRPTPDQRRADDNKDERRLQRADIQTYQSMVGALLFASTTCRPDIAHQVNLLTRRMVDPRVCDVQDVFTLFDYLRGAATLGILFKFEKHEDYPDFVAYADADWANDGVGRKSTSGYLLLFNGAPVSWHCSLQSVVALSSTEAEYVALAECSREVIYMRGVLGDMRGKKLALPTTTFEDNKGAIDLARNPVHHKRTKHIDVKHHFVRDAEQMGAVHIGKVDSDDNYSDIFTKVGSTVLRKFVSDLMFDVKPEGD